jgi:hypothetical protein
VLIPERSPGLISTITPSRAITPVAAVGYTDSKDRDRWRERQPPERRFHAVVVLWSPALLHAVEGSERNRGEIQSHQMSDDGTLLDEAEEVFAIVVGSVEKEKNPF